MHGYEIPDHPADLALTLETLRIRLRGLADVLEVTSDDLDTLDADTLALQQAERAAYQAREESRARESHLVSLLNGKIAGRPVAVYQRVHVGDPLSLADSLTIPGIRPRLDLLLDRITSHESWTPEIGNMLGLVPSESEWLLSVGNKLPQETWGDVATDIAAANTFAVGRNPREYPDA